MSNDKGDVDEAARQIADYLQDSARAVVFTGAGISTESGIPDFRSPGGLWTKFKPIEFSAFMSSEAMRIEAWRRKFGMDDKLGRAKPNSGHQAIARLMEMGKVACVITQNIDNLHQDSGASRVIELHGNATYAKCLECEKVYQMETIKREFLETQRAPSCDVCGGIVKSATISFGQPMPELEMLAASEEVQLCDLFLAIGSSLQVYPAAGFPILAKRHGARLIILNRESTDLDDLADFVVHLEIGEVLSRVPELL